MRLDAEAVLGRLSELRAGDPPTHGGRVLSYVYDPGLQGLDDMVAAVVDEVLPVNGLDPTTFRSVGVLESELVGFMRELLHGDAEVVGSATSGGTESCLLAVKTARDVWRSAHPEGRPRLVAPVTVHAAFQKAAAYFDLVLDLVPTDTSGVVAAADVQARLRDDVALVVLSAPNYPFASLDPIAEVADAASAAGIPLHVDACIGGLVLPFWRDDADAELPAWDFRVPGVTSVSADLHKYGYAPKGVSVLLQRGRDRQRHQYFATTRWPGYPVVNPTILGSKSAVPLAAGWAIAEGLGVEGFRGLAESCLVSTRALRAAIDGIEGLRVVGEPVGPLLAVATDETVAPDRRVDPHHWADAVRRHGFVLQLQPALPPLPSTTHLTITPVTESVLPELTSALVAGADAVRGVPHVDVAAVLGALPPLEALGALDSDTAWALLQGVGIGQGAELPDAQAPLVALIEALPAPVAERLLVELLGRLVEPR
ncbi:MAG: aspartate aminotransferase family protein [Microbacteriaceae bacterium]|nr:MAG: aspartate aminotransferase family protein [Microbacteriaceae bacterium]